jgi:hypothetical protein
MMRMVMGFLVSKGIIAVARGGKDTADMTPEECRAAQFKQKKHGTGAAGNQVFCGGLCGEMTARIRAMAVIRHS